MRMLLERLTLYITLYIDCQSFLSNGAYDNLIRMHDYDKQM